MNPGGENGTTADQERSYMACFKGSAKAAQGTAKVKEGAQEGQSRRAAGKNPLASY